MGGRRHCRWPRRRQSPVTLRSAWGFFHEVGASVSIRDGLDGDGGVWAGFSSASGGNKFAVSYFIATGSQGPKLLVIGVVCKVDMVIV
jgi:hypothetical protein